jgi:hypothetical protein
MSFAASKFLDLPHMQQPRKYDCWATCLAIICEWRGIKTTVPDIVKLAISELKGAGYVDDAAEGAMASCGEVNFVARKLTNREVTFTVLDPGIKIPKVDLVGYINTARPVVVNMLHHMWVIDGYNNGGDILLIHDVGRADGHKAIAFNTVNQELQQGAILNYPPVK